MMFKAQSRLLLDLNLIFRIEKQYATNERMKHDLNNFILSITNNIPNGKRIRMVRYIFSMHPPSPQLHFKTQIAKGGKPSPCYFRTKLFTTFCVDTFTALNMFRKRVIRSSEIHIELVIGIWFGRFAVLREKKK